MAEPYTDDELCEVRKRVGRLDLSKWSWVDFNPRGRVDREVIRLLATIDALKADPVCRSCGKPIARERSVCKRLWYILIRVFTSATLRKI